MVRYRFGDIIYNAERVGGQVTGKAQSHAPRIDAPDEVNVGEPFELRMLVGPHPNTIEHSIRRIDIYLYEEGREFNPVHIASFVLEPWYVEPEMGLQLRIKRSSVIYVLAYCNLHGVWESRKAIRVR